MLQWIRARLGAGGDARAELLRDAESALKAGETARAREACLAVLREAPEETRALCLMATVAADERRLEEGLGWAERALAIDPRSVAAHYATGRLWESAGRYDEAEASYRKVLSLDPSHARAHNNLGATYHMRGKLDIALACYRKALEFDPQLAEANQNLTAILGDAGALETAVEGFKRQIAANPRDAAAYNSLASLSIQLSRHQEALTLLDQAIALEPEQPQFHFSKAQLLLLLGDYAQGWKEYEWRWRMSAFNAPIVRFPQPVWDGGAIEGPLLIHCEGGFGDTLQFARYARLAAEKGAEVMVECQPALKPLLQGAEGVARVVSRGEPLPPFAAHIPMIGLPRILGTTLASVPWTGPYLRADPERRALWAQRIGAAAGIKVGLVWAGDPANWADRSRSITLAALAPLARARGVGFYSLQKGEPAAQAASPPAGMSFRDLTGDIRDFADTAALISHLDLVIAVETSVAHLAGAMGARTWILLAREPDWRWLLDREDSPWYPTMRLFRQERDGDWSAPIERMARALESYTPA
jgi:tetratricopeptide (TPR) repeat protein